MSNSLKFIAASLLTTLVSTAQAADAVHKVIPVSATGHDRFYGVAFDMEGNFYAAGSVADSTDAAADHKTLIVKFLADGTIDSTFGDKGYAIHNLAVGTGGEVARSVLVDSQGRVLVGGNLEAEAATDARDRDVYVIRLSADGSLDASYGKEGIARLDFSAGAEVAGAYVADGFGGMALDANDQIYVEGSQRRQGGDDTDFVITRLSSDGAVDTSFGIDGAFTLDIRNLSASAKSPVVLPDGSVIGTGYSREGTQVFPVVFKVTADGALDTSYGDQGLFTQNVLGFVSEVYSAVLHDDSLVTVGYGRSSEQDNIDFLSLRLTAEGKLDETYGTQGYVRVDVDGFNDNGRNMVALPTGDVMLVGGGRYTSTNVDGMVAILDASGTPNTKYGENGTTLFDFGGSNDFLWGAAVSPAGDKAVAVGIKGITGTDVGNDDAALVIYSL